MKTIRKKNHKNYKRLKKCTRINKQKWVIPMVWRKKKKVILNNSRIIIICIVNISNMHISSSLITGSGISKIHNSSLFSVEEYIALLYFIYLIFPFLKILMEILDVSVQISLHRHDNVFHKSRICGLIFP